MSTTAPPPTEPAPKAVPRRVTVVRRQRSKPTSEASFASLGRILVRFGAIALVLLIVAELGVRAIADHLPPPTTGDTQELVQKKSQMEARAAEGATEVVFLGNSTMDAGVDPTAFTRSSLAFDSAYNAALLGIPLDTQSRWYGEVVDPELDADVVVLGMNPVDVLQSYYTDNELAVVNASFQSRFREIEEGPAASLNRTAYEQSYLYRYRGSLRAPSHIVDATRAVLTGDEVSGIWRRPEGFFDDSIAPDGSILVYRDRVMQPATAVSAKLLRDLRRTLDSELRESRITRLLDQVAAAGHEAVVVVPPVALDVLAAAGLDAERWRNVAGDISEVANDAGVPVVNLSTAAYPTDLFSDPMHLNEAGSERFSFDLAEAIDAHCDAGAIAACERAS